MKVAHLTAHVSPSAGGFYYSVQNLVRHLACNTDVQVDVVGLADPHDSDGAADWGDLPLHLCRQIGPRRFGYSPGFGRWLDRLGADVVHVQGLWMYHSQASLGWSRRTGRPHLASPRGMLDPWAVRRSALKKRLVGLLFEHAHLREAACLHALSVAEAAAIRAHGLRNPICVIPNGVALPSKDVRPDPPQEARCVLFLGRLTPKKGLRELLCAWAMVQAVTKNWQLLVVGWDEQGHADELRRMAAALELGERVTFAGPRFGADKDATFRGADAFILPSFSEGLPMAVLEAWSYELPVLMTEACNLPEGFAASAGLRIAPDPGSIAEGIRALIAMSDAERERMGQAGRRLVEERFTWPAAARQMRDVYAWVLGGGSPPPSVVTD